ncbi:hypothetical protein [Marinicella rhabdoformis]|uniref:hypothetical protein n=1 Tax=Marinicella rhabdoformis TaxID=2580566 RepID=UPI0012AECE28|nr:hypothetical protein [Marinicella rhabdoformis]
MNWQTYMTFVLALAVLCLVPFSWYQAQKYKKQAVRWLWLGASMLALCGGFYLFQKQHGTEFAVFFVLFHVSWLAWIFISRQAKVKTEKQPANYVNKGPKGKPFVYKLSVFLLAGTLALLASILVSQALAKLLVSQLINQWATTLIVAPLVWGGLVTWLASDRIIYRPILVMIIFTSLSWWYIA